MYKLLNHIKCWNQKTLHGYCCNQYTLQEEHSYPEIGDGTVTLRVHCEPFNSG